MDHTHDPPPPRRKGFLRRWFWRLCLIAIIYTAWQLWHIRHLGYSDSGKRADCAIVLGAAAYHDQPSPVFKERIKHAVQLYRDQRVAKLLLTGGYGKGADFAESEVAKKYALEHGIPERDILIERSSGDTFENLKQASRLMKENGLSTALIVSDPWHLKRACAMASYYGITASPSATKTSAFKSKENRTKFLFKEFYLLHRFYLFNE